MSQGADRFAGVDLVALARNSVAETGAARHCRRLRPLVRGANGDSHGLGRRLGAGTGCWSIWCRMPFSTRTPGAPSRCGWKRMGYLEVLDDGPASRRSFAPACSSHSRACTPAAPAPASGCIWWRDRAAASRHHKDRRRAWRWRMLPGGSAAAGGLKLAKHVMLPHPAPPLGRRRSRRPRHDGRADRRKRDARLHAHPFSDRCIVCPKDRSRRSGDTFRFLNAWMCDPSGVGPLRPRRGLADLMTAAITPDTGPVLELGRAQASSPRPCWRAAYASAI